MTCPICKVLNCIHSTAMLEPGRGNDIRVEIERLFWIGWWEAYFGEWELK